MTDLTDELSKGIFDMILTFHVNLLVRMTQNLNILMFLLRSVCTFMSVTHARSMIIHGTY
jgi:hypothetical protein